MRLSAMEVEGGILGSMVPDMSTSCLNISVSFVRLLCTGAQWQEGIGGER